MRQIIKYSCFVVGFLLLAVYSMLPLDQKLRLGKDLSGGVSMVYGVTIGPEENAAEVLARTIDVLKRRVDPNGLYEISMVAQGRDRIEINMPLPTDNVKKLKAEFETALANLGRSALSEGRLEQAMRMPAAERAAEFAKMANQNASRTKLLDDAAAAYDLSVARRAKYDSLTDAALKDAMVTEVASAEIAYQEARAKVLKSALSADEVRKVLMASTRERSIEDGKLTVKLPSPRVLAEKRLKEQHPESVDEIEKVITLYNNYAAKRTTLDDPQDLVRMLKGAGVLSFRITVQAGNHPREAELRRDLRELGAKNVKSADARWYPLNSIEAWVKTKADADFLAADERNAAVFFQRQGYRYVVEAVGGEYYMLCYDTPQTRLTPGENGGNSPVDSARQSFDEIGKLAIAFQMTPTGGNLLGNLTRNHVKEPMAILLDDQVYTAPNLIEEIRVSGRITGDFSADEVDYIVRVLAGGSLQAKLSPEPISISSVGPELGKDNLEKGLKSGYLAMILVAVFMVFYYFWLGGVAVVSLMANAVLILGCMALSKAAFTMPGIAGAILTFGMAVDSNVLIYERMREEMDRGADLKTAIRLGYDRALSSIVDGNMTNLIVCVVLYWVGTPEIRGFAITMGIGVLTTLFAALVVSRLIFDVAVQLGWRKASMLPMAIPGLQNALTPRVDWIRLRYVFFAISVAYVGLGLFMIVYQGPKMLDTEFRGGTQVTLQFKDDSTGKPVTMTREQVQDRVVTIGKEAAANDELKSLESAEVFPINPENDGVTSGTFAIKTLATNAKVVNQAIIEKFGDVLDIQRAVTFAGSDAKTINLASVYPIDKAALGSNIDKPGVQDNVSRFVGGLAVVLDKIEPPQSRESIVARLNNTRQGEQFSDTLSRSVEFIVLAGNENSVSSGVVVVHDDNVSLFDNEARWNTEMKEREWQLVQAALTQESTPASVHNFTPSVADTFRVNAIKACLVAFLGIGVYIWVRFKQPRYSIAAVVALVHDVITVTGLVAICEVLYETKATHGFAQSIGLLPFKIDLNLVAALLTIAGYSLNDTVVIMDRIRENRGKLPYATRDIINTSINQTFSRTLITGGTTFGSCIILYVLGGEGMRAFAFALLTGLIFGTYSSVAIAAPIVWSRSFEKPRTEDAVASDGSKATA